MSDHELSLYTVYLMINSLLK